MLPRMTPEILPATEAAMVEVEAWLDVEEVIYQAAHQNWLLGEFDADIPVRGFRCNWDSTKRRWQAGESRVDILKVADEAIGFLAGTDILEIRPDLRGAGYGRILAEFMQALAYDAGHSVLEIDIAPSSAEPFWKRMGFTLVEDRQGNGGGSYAYKIFHRAFPLSAGARVPYEVRFYTQDGRYAPEPKPFARYAGLGERLPDGTVQLPERAICFNPQDAGGNDYFVRIELDGRELHFEKVRRESSQQLGVQRGGDYTYFIERIRPKAS